MKDNELLKYYYENRIWGPGMESFDDAPTELKEGIRKSFGFYWFKAAYYEYNAWEGEQQAIYRFESILLDPAHQIFSKN